MSEVKVGDRVWVGPMTVTAVAARVDGFECELEQPKAACTPFKYMAAHSSLVIPDAPALPAMAELLAIHEAGPWALLINTVAHAIELNDSAIFHEPLRALLAALRERHP